MKRRPKKSRSFLNVFEVVNTFETEEIAADDPDLPRFVFRIELLKDVDPGGLYHARVYRRETFRLQPTFPQAKGRPRYDPGDEEIFVGDAFRDWETFRAKTVRTVLAKVLSEIRAIFERRVVVKRALGATVTRRTRKRADAGAPVASPRVLHATLTQASESLNRAAAQIRDLRMNPDENVRKVGAALTLIFEIQNQIYRQRPGLTPTFLRQKKRPRPRQARRR